MTDLGFLDAVPDHTAWRSPLQRALAGAPRWIRDVSTEAEDGPLGRAGGVAGIELDADLSAVLLARVTDMEPPGIGAVAGVRALLTVERSGTYRLWFPREYADYLAGVVLDAWKGLA